ncbi:MAG TPA: preprotein translocase subunit YajC [Caulobacteraceae bacterium]|nr:preprotein translocase subunit YajC [Caulobacteraceae bacterium]
MDILASPIILPIALLALMYFFFVRPQQQRAKEHQTKIAGLKRGDTVVLSSGLIGKIVRIEDQELGLEIAQNVTVKVVKAMVSEVRTRGEPAPANANAKPAKPSAKPAQADAKDAKS